jgi:hypothetical protein
MSSAWVLTACYGPGDQPHLFYNLRAYRRRKGEPKGFSWADYSSTAMAPEPLPTSSSSAFGGGRREGGP